MRDPARRDVCVVTPHFTPEANAAARRITALVNELARQGWRVEVVTLAPHHPEDRIHPGYGVRRREIETTEQGVRISRYRPWIVPKGRLALRLLAETRFCIEAAAHVVKSRRKLVMTTSPYMFLGPALLLAARLRRAKIAWDVRDLTWEYLRATGRRTLGADRVIERVMRYTARRVDLLTTATEGQLAYFDRAPRPSAVIVNGLDPRMLETLAGLGRPPCDHGGRPRVLYAGLLGFPQGLQTLLDAAALMPDVDVVLAGDGPERMGLEDEARRRSLPNVTFTGFLDLDGLKTQYEMADVLVAHLRDDAAFEIAQPSKLWEYMATGRPVVYGGRGEAADLLTEHGIGLTARPGSAADLVFAIRTLLDDPTRAQSMGLRGRAFVCEHRNRQRLVGRWVGLLSDAVPSEHP